MDAREGLTENILYAQSGGVTSVINATACGVIKTARASKKFNKVFAAKNGILGVNENRIGKTKGLDTRSNLFNLLPGVLAGIALPRLKRIDG